MTSQTDPTADHTPEPSDAAEPARTSRRWAVPIAFVGGAAAVALLGGAALASSDTAPTTMQMVRGEHAPGAAHAERDGRMSGDAGSAMRMQRRSEVDPEVRGQRIAEHAQRLGVDVEALTAAMEAARTEHAAARDELSGLEPAERREAMALLAEARRSTLAQTLGVDAGVLAELHAEGRRAGHGSQGDGMGDRMGGRGAAHGRG